MIKTPLSTVIGGAFWTPGATIIGGQQSFSQLIKKLFANGERGFWYDPYDLGVMYQDLAGTTAVNATGQTLGLVLDKSKGQVLGPEVLTNSNFESGLSGVNIFDGNGSQSTLTLNTVNPISGTQDLKLTVVTSGSSRPGLSFTRNDGGGVIGGLYELAFDFKVVSGTVSLSHIYDGINAVGAPKPMLGTSGRYITRYIQLKADNFAIYFGSGTGVIQLDNVSLKRVQGNHAYQRTSAARPILQDAPRRIDFDAVDDKLITNLPAQLTGCTVVRSVPGVGVQLLTNQTIPATYEDNKDHCGLIVINRALTPSETSAIAAEFNKRAGV